MEQVMDLMNPMSERLPGTLFDQQRLIDEGLARRVKVPTLIVHDRDDGLVSIRRGEHTHESIPGSRLVTYPTGGHMLSGRMAAARQVVRGLLSSSGT
jgi:pimeloyl-ACP methyl ester carboxylesterase